MIYLTKELCEQALMGGLLLGGGGGGTLTAGREALEETFKHTDKLTMLDVSELKPDDVVVNVSTLGAPSAMGVHLSAEHWMTALKNFELNYGKKIAGFTSCENGAISTANGWIISALTGIPLVDAPSHGRAHPTGTMGSIGLNLLPDLQTTQSALRRNRSPLSGNRRKGSLKFHLPCNPPERCSRRRYGRRLRTGYCGISKEERLGRRYFPGSGYRKGLQPV